MSLRFYFAQIAQSSLPSIYHSMYLSRYCFKSQASSLSISNTLVSEFEGTQDWGMLVEVSRVRDLVSAEHSLVPDVLDIKIKIIKV